LHALNDAMTAATTTRAEAAAGTATGSATLGEFAAGLKHKAAIQNLSVAGAAALTTTTVVAETPV